MKLSGILSMLALTLSGVASYSQQLEAEVPGDNFSLEGALDLFKKSESPEHFERLLNSPDSKVNNLDLNGDGYIDYIRVFDRQDGNVHAFILQAVISERESQDIAVIELEKRANGKAVLQIIGDPDVYGVETIIEPTSEVRTYAGTRSSTTVVNVWAWPAVQYVYAPHYVSWYSPWGWRSRPVWWSPWRPIAYVHYHPIYVSYRPYYAYCDTRRIVHAHQLYLPHRTTSVVVYNRHHHHIDQYRSTYRDGYASRSRRDSRGVSVSTGRERSSSRDGQLHRTNGSSETRSSSPSTSEYTESKDRVSTGAKDRNVARTQRTKRTDFDKTDFKRTDNSVERQTRSSYEQNTPTQKSYEKTTSERKATQSPNRAQRAERPTESRSANSDFSKPVERNRDVSPARKQSSGVESKPTQQRQSPQVQRQSAPNQSMPRSTSPSVKQSQQRQAPRQMDTPQRSSSKPDAQRSNPDRGNSRGR